MAKQKLTWSTEKRKVSDLIDYDKNPRVIRDKQLKALHQSIEKFGYIDLVQVNIDNTIIGGHQRVRVLREQGQADTEIEVRVPSRELTVDEFQEINIRLNLNRGEFDFGKLIDGSFKTDMLLDAGFENYQLGLSNQLLDLATKPAAMPSTEEHAGNDIQDVTGDIPVIQPGEQPKPSGFMEIPAVANTTNTEEQTGERLALFESNMRGYLRDLLHSEINRVKEEMSLEYSWQAFEVIIKRGLNID